MSAEAFEVPPDIDMRLDAELTFPSGAAGTVSGSMRKEDPYRAELVAVGSRGTLTVVNPLAPQHGHEIRLDADGETTTGTLPGRPTYDHQLDAFVRAATTGESPPTGVADSVKQMRLVDAAYRAAGMRVRGE